jgi:cation transport regulator ChaB
MSTYRDTLPAGQRAAYEQAVREAGQALRDACGRRDQLAAERGATAVAQAAWHPGHRLGSVEAIERYYRGLQDEELRRLGRKVA